MKCLDTYSNSICDIKHNLSATLRICYTKLEGLVVVCRIAAIVIRDANKTRRELHWRRKNGSGAPNACEAYTNFSGITHN